jgi:hypothetical protein
VNSAETKRRQVRGCASSHVRKNLSERWCESAELWRKSPDLRVGIAGAERSHVREAVLQTTQASVAAFVRTREVATSKAEFSISRAPRPGMFATLTARLGQRSRVLTNAATRVFPWSRHIFTNVATRAFRVDDPTLASLETCATSFGLRDLLPPTARSHERGCGSAPSPSEGRFLQTSLLPPRPPHFRTTAQTRSCERGYFRRARCVRRGSITSPD